MVNSIVFDGAARVVLPTTAAVKGPRRFTSRDHERSRIVREVLDLFTLDVPQTPRPERTVDMSESIVLEGGEIRRTMRVGSSVVRQNSTAAIEIDDTPAPLAFEPVADTTLQADAAAALDRMATQRVRARVVARPATPTGVGGHVYALAVLVLGALAVAAWIAVRS